MDVRSRLIENGRIWALSEGARNACLTLCLLKEHQHRVFGRSNVIGSSRGTSPIVVQLRGERNEGEASKSRSVVALARYFGKLECYLATHLVLNNAVS